MVRNALICRPSEEGAREIPGAMIRRKSTVAAALLVRRGLMRGTALGRFRGLACRSLLDLRALAALATLACRAIRTWSGPLHFRGRSDILHDHRDAAVRSIVGILGMP